MFIVKDWENARTSLDLNPAILALAGVPLKPGSSSLAILTSFAPSLLKTRNQSGEARKEVRKPLLNVLCNELEQRAY